MGKKVVITGAWDYSGPDQAENRSVCQDGGEEDVVKEKLSLNVSYRHNVPHSHACVCACV